MEQLFLDVVAGKNIDFIFIFIPFICFPPFSLFCRVSERELATAIEPRPLSNPEKKDIAFLGFYMIV